MDRRLFLRSAAGLVAAFPFVGLPQGPKKAKPVVAGIWYGWGGNVNGTAGLGDLVPHTTGPVALPIGIDFTQISAGGPHCAAIDAAGNLYVWGSNLFYRLGTGEDPYATTRSTPYLITQVGLSNIVEVACTQRGTFARRGDGKIFFAGNNDDGQVGEGASGFDFALAPQPDLYPTFTQLTAWSALPVVQIIPGYAAVAMRTSDGKLYFAGANNNGEAGNGGVAGTDITAPTQWGAFTDITAASLSGSNLLVKRSNGQVWGSGYNTYGTLATGSTSGNQLSPVQCSTLPSSSTRIAVFNNTSYAIDASGHVWVAGVNSDGELNFGGDGLAHPTALDITTTIGDGTKLFSKLIGASSAEDNYCLLTTTGEMWAIGGNTALDGRTIDNSGLNKFVYTRVWPPFGDSPPVVDAVSPGSGEGVFLARTLLRKGRAWAFLAGL